MTNSKTSNFYWYQKNPQLYQDEVEAMGRFFPQFRLYQSSNGQLYWMGSIQPLDIVWTLQLVYNHNHPSKDTYGGSIHVYSVNPDLESLFAQYPSLGHHVYHGPDGLALCTNSTEDFRNDNKITTVASKLAWAVKWCTSYELWVNGELPEFEKHGVI